MDEGGRVDIPPQGVGNRSWQQRFRLMLSILRASINDTTRRNQIMSWGFETEPEYQAKLDWVAQFVKDEVEPLELVLGHRAC